MRSGKLLFSPFVLFLEKAVNCRVPIANVSCDRQFSDDLRNAFARCFDRFLKFRTRRKRGQKILVTPCLVPVATLSCHNDLVIHTSWTFLERHLRRTLSCVLFCPITAVGCRNLRSRTSLV